MGAGGLLLFGFGEPEAEWGRSRLGRVDEVGVVRAWEEFMRRFWGAGESRGEAIVDMVGVGCGRLYYRDWVLFGRLGRVLWRGHVHVHCRLMETCRDRVSWVVFVDRYRQKIVGLI